MLALTPLTLQLPDLSTPTSCFPTRPLGWNLGRGRLSLWGLQGANKTVERQASRRTHLG